MIYVFGKTVVKVSCKVSYHDIYNYSCLLCCLL